MSDGLKLWRVVGQLINGKTLCADVWAVDDQASVVGAFLRVARPGRAPLKMISYHELAEPVRVARPRSKTVWGK